MKTKGIEKIKTKQTRMQQLVGEVGHNDSPPLTPSFPLASDSQEQAKQRENKRATGREMGEEERESQGFFFFLDETPKGSLWSLSPPLEDCTRNRSWKNPAK